MVVASRKNQELYLIDFSNLFLSYRQYTRVVFAIIKQVLLKYNRVLYSLVYDFRLLLSSADFCKQGC